MDGWGGMLLTGTWRLDFLLGMKFGYGVMLIGTS